MSYHGGKGCHLCIKFYSPTFPNKQTSNQQEARLLIVLNTMSEVHVLYSPLQVNYFVKGVFYCTRRHHKIVTDAFICMYFLIDKNTL